MSVYSLFTDTAPWRARLGDPQYAGLANLGAAVTIPVRDVGVSLVGVGGDTVHRHVYWTLPEHAVKPGDTVTGAEVLEVLEAKDRPGNLLYRVVNAAA